MQSDRTATIVHAIPGRIRFRLDRSLRSPESLRSLTDTLSQMEGVRRVEVNPATGSLLLLYDPEVLNIEQLYLAARTANVNVLIPEGAAAELPSEEVSAIASRINSFFGQMDSAVFRFTGGTIDVKTLVPFGLATAALRQIAASRGRLATVPWYVLLWYSADIFIKYNRRPRGSGAQTQDNVESGLE